MLLNLQPRSFAARCADVSWDDIKKSVTPPDVKVPDGIMPPDLVRLPLHFQQLQFCTGVRKKTRKQTSILIS